MPDLAACFCLRGTPEYSDGQLRHDLISSEAAYTVHFSAMPLPVALGSTHVQQVHEGMIMHYHDPLRTDFRMKR